MREILFRGKRTGGIDVWVEGTGVFNDCINTWLSFTEPNRAIAYGIKHYTIRPETLGQYIGAEDKNGKKVFEGDIVKYTPRPKCTIFYQVIWQQEWSRFALEQWSTHKYHLFEWAEFSKVKYCCEVIGNIHDNPEILESLENNENFYEFL